MKIAVASVNGMVTEHFGYCESFSIFEAENNLIEYYAEYEGVILYRTCTLWVKKNGGIVCYGK